MRAGKEGGRVEESEQLKKKRKEKGERERKGSEMAKLIKKVMI